MKRIFSLIVILSLIVTMASCGKESPQMVDWTICNGKYSISIPLTWERTSSKEESAFLTIPDDTDLVFVGFWDESTYHQNYTDETIRELLHPTAIANGSVVDTMVETHNTVYGKTAATSVTYDIISPLDGEYEGKKMERIQRNDVLETKNGLLFVALDITAGKGISHQDESLNSQDQFIDRKKYENYVQMYEKVLASITANTK